MATMLVQRPALALHDPLHHHHLHQPLYQQHHHHHQNQNQQHHEEKQQHREKQHHSHHHHSKHHVSSIRRPHGPAPIVDPTTASVSAKPKPVAARSPINSTSTLSSSLAQQAQSQRRLVHWSRVVTASTASHSALEIGNASGGHAAIALAREHPNLGVAVVDTSGDLRRVQAAQRTVAAAGLAHRITILRDVLEWPATSSSSSATAACRPLTGVAVATEPLPVELEPVRGGAGGQSTVMARLRAAVKAGIKEKFAFVYFDLPASSVSPASSVRMWPYLDQAIGMTIEGGCILLDTQLLSSGSSRRSSRRPSDASGSASVNPSVVSPDEEEGKEYAEEEYEEEEEEEEEEKEEEEEEMSLMQHIAADIRVHGLLIRQLPLSAPSSSGLSSPRSASAFPKSWVDGRIPESRTQVEAEESEEYVLVAVR